MAGLFSGLAVGARCGSPVLWGFQSLAALRDLRGWVGFPVRRGWDWGERGAGEGGERFRMGIYSAVNALEARGQWAFTAESGLAGGCQWALTELSMAWLDAVNGHFGASIDID